MKKVFLKISQNSQGNTCVRVSFLIKLQASGTGFFLWVLRNVKEHLFYRTPADDLFWISNKKKCTFLWFDLEVRSWLIYFKVFYLFYFMVKVYLSQVPSNPPRDSYSYKRKVIASYCFCFSFHCYCFSTKKSFWMGFFTQFVWHFCWRFFTCVGWHSEEEIHEMAFRLTNLLTDVNIDFLLLSFIQLYHEINEL